MAALGAAVLSLTGSTPALAATDGFPDPGTKFTIRADNVGGSQCLTLRSSPRTRFSACNPGDEAQQWVQGPLDAEGYGLVFGSDGRCIGMNGRLSEKSNCDRPVQRKPIAWKQFPNGEVQNRDANDPDQPELTTFYWGAPFSAGTKPYLLADVRDKWTTSFTLTPVN
ncbi:hypothetical protein IQ60_38175 [Streptomyces europaeiscabiei]|nr:hypothetical protein IQ60_38175 [Streptomyces europaeiscabiei]